MQHINKISTIAVAVIISACGGGSDSETPAPNNSTQYVIYSDNANKHVILDGASTQFAVKSSNQKLVHLSSATELNGLLVANNGDISRDGQKIAAIILTTGQDGKTIAVLSCTGPAPNFGAMTINVASNGWTRQCASNTDSGGGSGGGSGGSGGNPDADPFVYDDPQNQCISVIRSPISSSQQGLKNSCNTTLDITFCIENGDFSQNECSRRIFKRAILRPGGYDSIDSYKGTIASVFAIACREPYYAPSDKVTFSNNKLYGRCQKAK